MIIDSHVHPTPQIMLKAFSFMNDRFQNIQSLKEDDMCRLAFMGQASTRPVPPETPRL